MFATFSAYAAWIELETFFSGFTFIYDLYWIYFQKGNRLGLSYALVATLFWGLQLKNYFPYHNWQEIITSVDYPLLKIWAMVPLLFWIPAFRKNSLLPLLHSLVSFA